MSMPYWFRLTALVVSTCLSTAAFAQTATVLDGIYSAAQAQRGARTYQRICAHCHEGGEPDADPLFGGEFIDRWREAPLSYLHGFFSTKMPADEPGSLSATVYLETLAFLLRENGYPPGTSNLEPGQLNSILLTGPAGPEPLPPNSLVLLVGCLAPAEGEAFVLAQASVATRVRTADETTAEELAASTASAPGVLSYQLRNADRFAASTNSGQRVQAKGVLSPQSTPPSLNVLSLESTGQACD